MNKCPRNFRFVAVLASNPVVGRMFRRLSGIAIDGMTGCAAHRYDRMHKSPCSFRPVALLTGIPAIGCMPWCFRRSAPVEMAIGTTCTYFLMCEIPAPKVCPVAHGAITVVITCKVIKSLLVFLFMATRTRRADTLVSSVGMTTDAFGKSMLADKRITRFTMIEGRLQP